MEGWEAQIPLNSDTCTPKSFANPKQLVPSYDSAESGVQKPRIGGRGSATEHPPLTSPPFVWCVLPRPLGADQANFDRGSDSKMINITGLLRTPPKFP